MANDTAPAGGQIRFAIDHRRLVEVHYRGTGRVVEPHDFGVQRGRERLLVFQLSGSSRPGRPSTGWRLLDVEKIEALTVLDETFPGSRGGSSSDHLKWDVVYARVR